MPVFVCLFGVSQSRELTVVEQVSVENEEVRLVDWTGAARLTGSPRETHRASRKIKEVLLSDSGRQARKEVSHGHDHHTPKVVRQTN